MQKTALINFLSFRYPFGESTRRGSDGLFFCFFLLFFARTYVNYEK
jgi:hypothetical protein